MSKGSSAGAGGNWPIFNEDLNEPSVVGQITDDSCVAACGEMLSNGHLTQTEIINEIGAPVELEELAPLLGENWLGGYVRNVQRLLAIENKIFAANMLNTENRAWHALVVDGLDTDENVVLRDPWEPSKYNMTLANFDFHCTGVVVFEKD